MHGCYTALRLLILEYITFPNFLDSLMRTFFLAISDISDRNDGQTLFLLLTPVPNIHVQALPLLERDHESQSDTRPDWRPR